jgi:hypothetical protein
MTQHLIVIKHEGNFNFTFIPATTDVCLLRPDYSRNESQEICNSVSWLHCQDILRVTIRRGLDW